MYICFTHMGLIALSVLTFKNVSASKSFNPADVLDFDVKSHWAFARKGHQPVLKVLYKSPSFRVNAPFISSLPFLNSSKKSRLKHLQAPAAGSLPS